jgi:hypothetical protein
MRPDNGRYRRAFAGSVGTEQPEDFAGADVEMLRP